MKKILRILLVNIICVSMLATPWLNASAQAPVAVNNTPSSEEGYASGEVIVKFKQKPSKATQEQIEDAAGAEKITETIGPESNKNTQVLELKDGTTVKEAVKELEKQKLVEYAEPNYTGKALFTPNDSSFNIQWSLNNTGQAINGIEGKPDADIDMPEAWNNIGALSKTAVIAVIDSGIDLSHPDISSNIWQNTDEIAGNDKDDDNNGYVDDVKGYNWAKIDQKYYFTSYEENGQTYYNYYSYPLGKAGPDPAYSDIAQSFKGNGGYIKNIEVALKRNGLPDSGITVSIISALDGDVLASVDIAPSDILPNWVANAWSQYPTASWIKKPLSAPLKVDNSSEYYLVIHTDNQDNDKYYEVGSSVFDSNGNIDNYPDGKAYLKTDSWTDKEQDDIAFKLNFDSQKYGKGGGIPNDGFGHGTHVSGIAAAQANNGSGISGLAGYPADAAKIMPLRGLDSQGSGFYADWAEAIYYAADNGADVINMSIGGWVYSDILQNAVNYAANEKGVTVISSVGNMGDSSMPKMLNRMSYPAGLNNVVGVGATDNLDERASYSTYNSSVDLSAPGANIYSTTPTYPSFFTSALGMQPQYDFASGTSMSSPAVAGLAALIRAKWGDSYTPVDIEQLMRDTAEDLGEAGRDDNFGSGRINAVRVFDSIAPTLTIATTAPSSTNTSPMPFTFNFSEPVNGFEASDITTTNGLVQNFTGSGTTYAADIAPINDGTVSVDVDADKAQDEAGNGNTAATKLSRTYDTTPPSAFSLSAPAEGALTNLAYPTFSWSASADSDSGLSRYELFIDGSNSSPGRNDIYYTTTSLKPAAVLADGKHTWFIRAVDKAGNTTDSQTRTLTVDKTPPSMAQGLSTQGYGKYVKGVINLKANVTDGQGMKKVSYFLDSSNSFIGSNASGPFSVEWNTLTSANGDHNILTYAFDTAGNWSKKTTLLKVDNYKPRTKAPRKAKAKKGKKAKLYYKVTDPYTGGKASVTIRIKKAVKKRLKGKVKTVWKTVKIVKLGLVDTGKLNYKQLRLLLAKGKYKYFVYAKDQAGNKQKNIAKNDLLIT